MTTHGPPAEDLRRRFFAAAERSRPSPDCPDLDAFWDAQRGKLTGTRTRELVEHTVRCPACAEAWRVAHALGAMEEGSVRRRPSAARWAGFASAAAVLAVAIGLATVAPNLWQEAEPTYRTGPVEEIVSLIPDDARLPRDGFVLRWSPGPEGTLYGVRLTTRTFERVAVVDGLERPEWPVTEDALSQLESGTDLLWRVEALLPDGRRVQSATFFVSVE